MKEDGTLWDGTNSAPISLLPGGTDEVYESAVKLSVLSKMNRDGAFEKNVFVLSPRNLVYFSLTTRAASSVRDGELSLDALPSPAEIPRVFPLFCLAAL